MFCIYCILKVTSIKITTTSGSSEIGERNRDRLSYLLGFLLQLGIAQVICRKVALKKREQCDNLVLRIAVRKPDSVWGCSEEEGGG